MTKVENGYLFIENMVGTKMRVLRGNLRLSPDIRLYGDTGNGASIYYREGDRLVQLIDHLAQTEAEQIFREIANV